VEAFSNPRANAPGRLALVLLLLCVLVVACLGVVYFAGDLSKLQEAISTKESQAALRGVSAAEQLDQAIKQYPSNRILKLIALANKDSMEIDAVARKLSAEAGRPDLPNLIDLSASSRSDLDALRRDMKTAESNAASLKLRYIALIKEERDKLESEARALKAGNSTIARFMAMIDEQHAEMIALTSKVLMARAEYYSAYEKCIALLVREFGIYKVANGQFIFPFQSTANSYNGAAEAMAAAAKRIADLEDERTSLRQSQLSRWKAFVDQ